MNSGLAVAALLLVAAAPAVAQPFAPGTGLSPLGNLRTSDRDGETTLQTPRELYQTSSSAS